MIECTRNRAPDLPVLLCGGGAGSAAITDKALAYRVPGTPPLGLCWNRVRQWLDAHPGLACLGPLQRPAGNNALIASEERDDEDLSRLPR